MMSEICSIPTETCEEATKLRGEITHKEGSFTHSDKIRGDTCRELFFGSELLVRSCSGVNDQCLRIAHVGKVTDRKSTRLNSSHQIISYAVFCLKKKNNEKSPQRIPTETPDPVDARAKVDMVTGLTRAQTGTKVGPPAERCHAYGL